MSVQAMTKVLNHSRLPSSSRFVLLVLANYEGDSEKHAGSWAWPSLDRLAQECGMSIRQVQRHIRAAEVAGELEVRRGAGPHGRNLCRVTAGDVPKLWDDTSVRGDADVTAGGDISVRGGDRYGPSMSPELKEQDLALVEDQASEVETSAPTRRRDALFETVAEVCGIDWHHLTASARGSLNAAVGQLRAVGAEPGEVTRRAALWPYDVRLTPPGLAKHWPALAEVQPMMSANGRRVEALADRLEREGR